MSKKSSTFVADFGEKVCQRKRSVSETVCQRSGLSTKWSITMIENIKSQMRKGILEYCILSIINRQEVYTSDILEALRQADLLVVEGTLYPLLSRLKNNGILSYQWQESVSGPPRKYYELTESGQVFLSELENGWEELARAIELLRTKNDIIKI